MRLLGGARRGVHCGAGSLAQIRFRGRHYACSVGCPVMHDSLGSSMPQFDGICFWTQPP